MSHSVRSYLERQSTEKLDKLLKEELLPALEHSESKEVIAEQVRMILDVLKKRETQMFLPLPPKIGPLWAAFKQELYK